MNDTELRLAHWRDGSTQGERLAAALLGLAGYEAIDPQHPLGGPDGKKDIICSKGGIRWIGAVHFPIGPVRFTATKAKFSHDLAGVGPERGGIAYVTNQSLSQSQRHALVDLAGKAEKEADIFHLERLRSLLDSPTGFAARIQYLRIPMTLEDQLTWFADSGDRVTAAVNANTRELLAVRAMVERMSAGQKEIVRTMKIAALPASGPVATPDLLSVSMFTADKGSAITRDLTPSLILLFHRLLCFDLPTNLVGRLRRSEVALAGPDGSPAAHVQPTPAAQVAGELDGLCAEWRRAYAALGRRTVEVRLIAMAAFHARLLTIHPFMDGNGRVARGILMQQSLDLFGRADMSLMAKGGLYYRALAEADKGQPGALADLIREIVKG